MSQCWLGCLLPAGYNNEPIARASRVPPTEHKQTGEILLGNWSHIAQRALAEHALARPPASHGSDFVCVCAGDSQP